MRKFLLHWLVGTVALLVIARIVPGIAIDNWTAAPVAALILGILNTFLKPLIILITLPITVLTLGLFTVIINGFMLYVAAKLVQGFTVTGFWSALGGALLFSIISFFLNAVLTPFSNTRFAVSRGTVHRQGTGRRNVIDAEVLSDEGENKKKK